MLLLIIKELHIINALYQYFAEITNQTTIKREFPLGVCFTKPFHNFKHLSDGIRNCDFHSSPDSKMLSI